MLHDGQANRNWSNATGSTGPCPSRACGFQIEGVASVLPFHRAVLEDPDFTGEAGFKVYTNWIETAFRGIEPAPRVDPVEGGFIRSFIEIDGKRLQIGLPAALFSGVATPQIAGASARAVNADAVTSPIPGTLQKWLIEDGAEVVSGQSVALIEAMKMETQVTALKGGRIRIIAAPGTMVALGAELAIIA